VIDVRMNFGHTRIPRRGAVLSFGGTDLPENLAQLVEDVRVTFQTTWKSAYGLADSLLSRAASIVSGAGLLRRDGKAIVEWPSENLNQEAFTDARHPRTIVGVDHAGTIWLGVIDGRQPDFSIGMTFADLQRLCDRLGLVSALNLDGGGSTTMVVNGRLVNKPSDPEGPRPVSDAIVVTSR
jgi:exopolysaccharide biosynthesis protein